MKINIRRGANQIGGSAVEFTASNGERIVVDLGLPLDAEENRASLLPDIKGLLEKTPDLLGLIISHPHQDHFALGLHIDPTIPVYTGAAANRIMRAGEQFGIPGAFTFKNIHTITGFETLQLGAFKITPYPVDHSAYDAYALLIEADEKRVFYSGDFRAHGRTAKRVEHIINNPPHDVDLLLMEGSSLGRDNGEGYESEASLEARFREVFKSAEGIVAVQTSAQNIDRLVTIYRAAKETERKIVMSGYAGFIVKSVNHPSIPNFTWDDVKKMVAAPSGKPHEITAEQIAANPKEYVVLLSLKIPVWLENAGLFNRSAVYIWSMWDGYKEDKAQFLKRLADANVKQLDMHTSGHADIPTLKRFAANMKPARIVPIHTFEPERYNGLFGKFARVELHPDNEYFEV
jgi:ribonuclease J